MSIPGLHWAVQQRQHVGGDTVCTQLRAVQPWVRRQSSRWAGLASTQGARSNQHTACGWYAPCTQLWLPCDCNTAAQPPPPHACCFPCCTDTKAAQAATPASSSSGSSIQPPPASLAVVPTAAQGSGSPSSVKLHGRHTAGGPLSSQAMVEWQLPGCKDSLVSTEVQGRRERQATPTPGADSCRQTTAGAPHVPGAGS